MRLTCALTVIAMGADALYIEASSSNFAPEINMRAEHEKLVGDIKQSLTLLRRSL
jgi:hypothetical protein